MKKILVLLFMFTFSLVSYGNPDPIKWPSKHHFNTPQGFNYKKLYKKHKKVINWSKRTGRPVCKRH